MNLKDVLTDVLKERRSKPVSLKEFMAALEKTGRGKDTRLVHVTDNELAMLKKMSKGKRNPDTGLMAFGEGGAPGGPSGGGPSGDEPGGGGVGGGVGGPGGGGIGLGRGDVDPQAVEASMGRMDPFGPEPAAPAAPGPGRGDLGDPTAVEGAMGRAGLGEGLGVDSDSAEANANMAKAVNALLNVTPIGLLNAPGSLMGEKNQVGLANIARGIGEGIAGITGVGAGEVGPANPLDPATSDPSNPPPPPPGPPPTLTRPEAMAPPHFLGIQQAMTPIQQRALLATRGVSGDEGAFRSPEAQDFYRNLLMRDIITDTGEIAPNAQILPVEAQYMQDILGLSATPDMDIERFARALQGLPLDAPALDEPEPEPVLR